MSQKRKHHASMACISCRESKVKQCDGGKPKCSSCMNKHRECRYQVVDKRRLPLRVAIELLSSRVDQLCLFIRQNGLEAPPMPEEKDTALVKVLDILGLTEVHSAAVNNQADKKCSNPNSTSAVQNPLSDTSNSLLSSAPGITDEIDSTWAQASPDSTSQKSQSNITMLSDPHSVSTLPMIDTENLDISTTQHCPPTDEHSDASLANWDWTLDFGTYITPSSPDIPEQSTELLQPPVEQLERLPEPFEPAVLETPPSLDSDTRSTEEIEDLIDELSDRMGTLRFGPGGKARFYGPTSTFNLADAPVSTNTQTHRSLDYLDDTDWDRQVPLSLEDHLLTLYFTWQDPSFHVVDRELFEKGKTAWYRKAETPFYSEALCYAMCSLGAAFETRYHPSFVTFPKSLGEFFGDRAKELLEIELDSPCVATVQALVILSSHEIGVGSDTRGWLYSGMALRLAFDLALHIDLSPYVARGSVTAADAELRRTVFWAAYMVDHLVGFYLGRPFYTNMEDVTVKKPNNDVDHREPCKWTPYASPIPFDDNSELLDCMGAVSQQEVTLCELMAPCGYFLYGTSGIPRALLQQLNENNVAKLLNWKAQLPSYLQINLNDHTSPYLPHVLLLHMQYYQNLIYTHRPWMSKGYLQPQPPKGPGSSHAREMCINSAISIAKILVLYETRYTLRRINIKAVSITSSAVLLLLFAAVSQYKSEEENIIAHLSTCFRALDEFSLSWQSANRAKDLLVRLQHKWEVRTRATKPDRGPDGAGYPPKKRSRTLNGSDSVSNGGRLSNLQPEARDFQLESGLGWMLMLSGQLPSDGDEDLYSFVANTNIPESEYETI
ncbi:transcriptional regulator family: Fungal Specific TF [Penicillium coprophilum]|uniref:transcriptional regulator family: Fungal Specific TF n=1 Tax=Penicillium coprophilum TaxID=36646 RepID=UPI00238B2269|nr:transcriptional regulator family: Fungal Specific TF [Penicillium coprophilum]KAJ5170248.1 transcriptional regulator family: Fungal Specific TF [Penicillium coprophilum]